MERDGTSLSELIHGKGLKGSLSRAALGLLIVVSLMGPRKNLGEIMGKNGGPDDRPDFKWPKTDTPVEAEKRPKSDYIPQEALTENWADSIRMLGPSHSEVVLETSKPCRGPRNEHIPEGTHYVLDEKLKIKAQEKVELGSQPDVNP